MALVVVAEDDDGTRKLMSVALRNQGHDVLEAADGHAAWSRVLERCPDLIVSDINMPGFNGLELLRRVRAHADLGLTPFILLTSLQERSDMRQGMTQGADDYLTKPLRPRELIDAVSAQLERQRRRQEARTLHLHSALSEALEEQAWALQDMYERRLARELSEQWPGQTTQQASTFPEATVLFADIRHVADWNARLDAVEMGLLLKRFFERSGDTLHLFGASHLQFVGEGLLAVFADPEPNPTTSHVRRAAKAALGMRAGAAGMDMVARQLFPDRALPAFDVGVALQTGAVAMTQLDGLLGQLAQRVPVGEAVMDAMAMQRLCHASLGGITVAETMVPALTGLLRPLARHTMRLSHRPVDLPVCAMEPDHG